MVFFTFPEDARWNPPTGLPSNSGLRSANIEASFACLVAYSSSYSGTRPHRNGASKPIISIELGLNSSWSGRSGVGN